nr:MAG TPA: hypothetical protein [Bacteriophage sp.]
MIPLRGPLGIRREENTILSAISLTGPFLVLFKNIVRWQSPACGTIFDSWRS